MNAKNDPHARIGARLKEARILAGLSQAQVAKILKIPRPSVSEFESGRRRVSADELRALCDTYDVSIEWVLGTGPEALSANDPRVELAARELAKIKPEDLDRLMRMLAAIRKNSRKNE